MADSESHFCSFDANDSGDAAKSMRALLGPQAVDQVVRQAISTCWMILPEDKKSVATLEGEIRRIVDRALDNFRDDCEAFGTPKDNS